MAIIERILWVLEEEGSKKKTHLAARANLNYATCTRYLAFLKGLRWIDFDPGEGGEVHITGEGKRMGESMKEMVETLSLAQADEGTVAPVRRIAQTKSAQGTLRAVDYSLLSACDKSDSQKGMAGSPAVDQPRKARQKPFNILLLDDDEDILTTYRLLINEAGFNVRTFTDAQRALRDLKKYAWNYYDVIITDIRMKPMNGLQFYREIRRISPRIKVIFISALDAAEELISIFPDVNADQVIRKPVERVELIGKIRSVSGESRQYC